MRKLSGMTVVGMLLTAALVICFALIGARIGIVYIKHFSVLSSIQGLSKISSNELSSDRATNRIALRNSLMKRLYINEINYIKAKQIKIKPKGNDHYLVNVDYDATTHLVANISLLFKFHVSEEITVGKP